jgi:hypothetical protein
MRDMPTGLLGKLQFASHTYQLISEEWVLGNLWNQFGELLSSHMFLVLAQGCQRQ